MKPLKLNRLPKAGRLRAVRYKRTTPGNFTRLIAPAIERGRFSPEVVDPSHPWAKTPSYRYSRKLPIFFKSDVLVVHAYPKALLSPPPAPRPDVKEFTSRPTIYDKDGKVKGGSKTINMSLMHVIGKKNVHKFSAVRTRIKRRIKAAVNLIVTRDADVRTVKGKQVVVSNETDDGEKWILQDWTYVFRPSLEVYRMPFPTLISYIREALEFVNASSRRLNIIWELSEVTATRQRRRESRLSQPEPNKALTDAASQREASNKRGWANSIANFGALLLPFLKEHKAKVIDPLLHEEDPLPLRKELDKKPGSVDLMFSRKPILKIPYDKTKQDRKI
ncbi:hypothetical protein ACEPAF_2770 [Sanghuangporus sanghuang]